MDPAAIWDQIAVLFQDYGEYYYTAAENIWFGHVSQPPDEMRLRDAANRARVHTDLAALSDGYETSLGRWLEEGAELSGGQWKKLALARSLYRKAPILILDEPTAGLDPESASGVIDDLPTLANGRCLIVVSHNVAVARRAHRIYVMREGHVAEQGTHEQLMSQGAYYAGLYHMQLQAIQQGSNGQ
jgi:ATP-binding cassette subfamily B protein